MLLWTIARRFSKSLHRDGFARFTTTVAIISVSLGTIAVCISQSILAGYEEAILDASKRFGTHLTLHQRNGALFDDTRTIIRELKRLDGVVTALPVIQHEVLAKHHSRIDGAFLLGMPIEQMQFAFVPLGVTLDPRGIEKPVLIGSGLQKRLSLNVGDTIVCITKSLTAERPIFRPLRVTGVYNSGMASYDDHAILLPLDMVQGILGSAYHSATMLMIRTEDNVSEQTLIQYIDQRHREQLEIRTYREHFAAMWNWIELQRRPIPVIMSLIALVSMFTVVSSIILSIVEKTRSFAVLSTLGLAAWRVATIVGLRTLYTTFVGLAFGITISVAFILVQRTWHPIALDGSVYYVRYLPVALDPWILAQTAFLVMAASMIAAIVPMVITVRIRPVQALRFR